MGARVYDPHTGTFTQPDPIQGGGANAYGYTDGDPVNETDLSGNAVNYGCMANLRTGEPFDSSCESGGPSWGTIAQFALLAVPGVDVEDAGALAAEEGVYVIRGAEETYVGQSGNITARLAQHVASGRFTQEEADGAERIAVAGGKTAREVAEQQKIDQLGGIGELGNARNPIGRGRFGLMPKGYARP